MIVIVEEKRDGIFMPKEAVVADWFIVLQENGTKYLTDGKGHKQYINSVDDALQQVSLLNLA